MIFDADDFFEGHDRMDLLLGLKTANPAFRMTAFAVPEFCSESYLGSIPDWIEIAAHGSDHGGEDCSDAHEAEHWTYEQTSDVLTALPDRFVHLWKSPGWLVSDGTYRALDDLGWAIADQHYNDSRRPPSLAVHCLGDGDHVHTHVQNTCGNGLEETFQTLLYRVERAKSFELISEVVAPFAKVAA